MPNETSMREWKRVNDERVAALEKARTAPHDGGLIPPVVPGSAPA